MKRHTGKSRRTIEIETYVTLREDWSPELAWQVDSKYQARGHRVVAGRMEWQYFKTEDEATRWCNLAHRAAGGHWENNSLQFPRLIAELMAVGAFTKEAYTDLCDNMDLVASDLDDLIERAQAEWELGKQIVGPINSKMKKGGAE